MDRIDAHLQRLQPVAVDEALEGKSVGLGRNEAVERGKCRRLLFTHPGKDDAVVFHYRVGGLADALVECGARRLAGLFQALSVFVEEPAVEGAAQAAILEPAKEQVGAAVTAVAADKAERALLVAEQDEPLAEQGDGPNRALLFQLLDKRHRLPVLAQHLTGRRAGADAG